MDDHGLPGACDRRLLTDERFTRKPALKALEFSLCMAPREEAALKRGDVG